MERRSRAFRSRERSRRDRRSRSRSRDHSPRKRHGSSKERSRDRGRDQDMKSNQRRNCSSERGDEKRKRQSSSSGGEGSPRKRKRRSSPSLETVTTKGRKDLSSVKASATTTCRSPKSDAGEDEEDEDLARKKMELEQLDALIAEKLAEHAALELEMTSSVVFDGKDTVLPCQTSLSPQHQRATPPLRQAPANDLYDQMDEEYKKQLKEVRLGRAKDAQRDVLRHYDRAARFRKDLCAGVEPVLCVEVQFLRQPEEGSKERCVHDEHHRERNKSIEPYNQKREDQTPILGQHEQKISDMHGHSDEGRPFPKGATLGKSIDVVETGRLQSRHGHGTDRKDKTVWICGHGLVAVARRISLWPECGVRLGNLKGLWSGTQGMTWRDLVPHLKRLRKKWPLPDILIIHLGDDDINMTDTVELLITIREELTRVRSLFPQCLIVWSDILPTFFWQQSTTPDVEVDEAAGIIHDIINCRAHAIVTELGGGVITHDNIGPEYYFPNDVYLSDEGIQRFNQNLQQFVENWEKELIPTSKHRKSPHLIEITSYSPEPTNIKLEPVDPFHDSLSHSVDDLDVTREDSGHNTSISLQQSQKDVNSIKNASRTQSPPDTSTAPAVASTSSPAVSSSSPPAVSSSAPPVVSSSGTPRPEESVGRPVNHADADLDMTPEDSGYSIISLQQSQKDVNCTESTAQPHSSVSTSTQKHMKSKTYKTIWMCGYAISGLAKRIAAAQKQVSKLGTDGPNIGVHHVGGPGMTCTDVVVQMRKAKGKQPHPDLLIIHLGNNIKTTKKEQLLNTVKGLLTAIHSIFPQCQIVWSDMLLLRFSKQNMTPSNKADEAADRIHQVMNRAAHAVVKDLGGRVITHDNIGPELYRPGDDEMVISDQGIRRFNLNIQQFVDEWKRQVHFVAEHKETILKSPAPTINSNLEPTNQFQESLSHSVDNLDITREDSGHNTSISLQQSQKDVNSPKNASRPKGPPDTSAAPAVSSSLYPAEGDSIDVTPLDKATIPSQQKLNQKLKPIGSEATVKKEVVEDVCSDLFEGTVLRLPAKDKGGVNNMVFNRNKELLLGSLQTSVGGVEKKLSFSADDVLTRATMLVGNKVQFKISTNPTTKAERAVTVEILADTLQRHTGVVVGLSKLHEFGYIKYPQDDELYFKFCEVMEEKILSVSEKVEFTVVPQSPSKAGKHQAIRVKRLTESVLIPAVKLEALGTGDQEKQVRKSSKNPVEENQTHGSSAPITGPGTKTSNVKGPPKVVWMCGFALGGLPKRIKSLQQQAAKRGSVCANIRVHQWGAPQMSWSQLVMEMCRFKRQQPRPDMLLIHLGGANVDLSNAESSLNSIRRDLARTHAIFPQCLIVWSNMLVGGSWTSAGNEQAAANVIDRINHEAHSFITSLGGKVIAHKNIWRNLYLSNKAIKMLSENIHRFLDEWAMGVNPKSEVLNTTSTAIAPPTDSAGPTSGSSHVDQNASQPHSPAATSSAPAVASSSAPAATSSAPAIASSSAPAATSSAPAVASSSAPAATSSAPAATSSAAVASSSAPAATSSAPAVASSSAPAAGDHEEVTPEDSGNSTASHQCSHKQQVRKSNESPVEENQTHGSSAPITGPGTKTSDVKGPPKVVWMCGFALGGLPKRIKSLQQQAAKRGSACANIRVHQWGAPQMSWSQLVMEMCRFKRQQPRPDMLLIHLGGANVDLRHAESSLNSIRRDLAQTHAIFPQCLIVWSNMLVGGSWTRKISEKAAAKVIDFVNHEAQSFITSLGGKVIAHENIWRKRHLSNKAIKMLNENIHRFLDEWAMGVNPKSEVLNTTSTAIAPPTDSAGPTSGSSHVDQNASQPHSPPATSSAPAVASSSAPAATSSAPAATSSAAVASSSAPAAGDHEEVTPEDSGNSTASHQCSHKQQVRKSNESPVEENQTHGSSAPITGPGTKTSDVKGPPKVVWMCGFALGGLPKRIKSLQQQAAKRGSACANIRVHQWGTADMSWRQLVMEMCRFKRQQPRPDMLLIHLGGANVDLRHAESSLNSIRRDLAQTHAIFPQCLIVWSNMLVGGSWTRNISEKAAAKVIDFVNHEAQSFITSLGGKVIAHENIWRKRHLSNKAIKMLNENIHRFLDEWAIGVNPKSEVTNTTSTAIAPPTDSAGPTSGSSHVGQNASQPHSPPATSSAPAVASSSAPAATSSAPATTSSAPAVASSSAPAATSSAPAVASSSAPAAGDHEEVTPEDSENSTASHQCSHKVVAASL
ncbi:uncharacterized protein LOC134063570 isoform X2 [Sardina pilchardus]|uniref:uncharacterized protein LOC134063570 isoform X2 n=1 Tax=Sardina pilchardus TaxID=27697 RepID=UPI002E132405